jgi:hypothetical protein
MSALETAMDTRDLLLRDGRGRAPLELYTRLASPREFHFYAQGVTPADFGRLFEAEIRPLEVFITRMPPELLNPNYWEPLTRETENEVRDKLTGIVTRSSGERAEIWRADRIARTRLLRDGLDVPVELLHGYLFRTSGEGLLKLAAAWTGRGRFEWTAVRLSPKAVLPDSTLSLLHNDIAQMRLSIPEEAFLFASQDDGLTRAVVSERGQLRRAVEALVRGFLHGATRSHVGRINAKICDQIAELADGSGLSADPDRDVVITERILEIHAWMGRTPWGVTPQPGYLPISGDERVLVYYDRISGLWAVSR